MKRYKSDLIRYGLGLLTFVVCAIVSTLLHRFSISDQGLLILAALGVAAWFGGTGPGLMVAILIELVSWAGTNRQHSSTLTMILGEMNRGAILIVIALIIGARKKSDIRLREQREWLEVTLSSIDDAVITTDLNGIVSFMNTTAENMTGWALSDANGKMLDEVFRFAEAELPRGSHSDVVLVSKDGKTIRIEFSVAPLCGDSGQARGSVLTFRDVTEHKLLQDQFRQAQKMEAVGQLAGGVAHDFNNLLTVILGYCQLAQMKAARNNAISQDLDQIHEAGLRATGLVSQLLAFSRKQVLRPRVFGLNEVVASAEKMLRRLIGEDIDLVTQMASDVGSVMADSGQIEQIILNLAVNARDAMPEGGKLTIETANVELDENYAQLHADVVPGNYILLAVTDTGHGMDTATQSRIFEPFFTTKEMGKGTGLGLSTVYGIVKQSGGHIWLYSELDRGTTFKIYLPRVEDPVKPAELNAPEVNSFAGHETVLLTEDDEAVRLLAERILGAQGYNVLVAKSGTEAIEITRKNPDIALLITDLVMPGLNGRQLASTVGELQPLVKVLFLSGYAPTAMVHQGVLENGVAFLPKPFTPDALAKKVREELDRPAHVLQ